MQKWKIIAVSIVSLLVIGLGFICYDSHKRIVEMKNEISIYENNIKAYKSITDSLENESIAFKYTIKQLKSSKDSILNKLNKARKEIAIKDDEIKSLEYLAFENKKIDTLFVHDTIFKKDFYLDSTITDAWSTLHLTLQYPDLVAAEYGFVNETYVIAASKKETIDEPKKCFIARWFQKKHNVIRVQVIQQNPYCTENVYRHYEIIE